MLREVSRVDLPLIRTRPHGLGAARYVSGSFLGSLTCSAEVFTSPASFWFRELRFFLFYNLESSFQCFPEEPSKQFSLALSSTLAYTALCSFVCSLTSFARTATCSLPAGSSFILCDNIAVMGGWLGFTSFFIDFRLSLHAPACSLPGFSRSEFCQFSPL